MEPKWLSWAKQLQAIAQAGLEYSKDKFDLARFQQIRDLSVEIMNEYTDMTHEKIKDLFCNEKGYQTPKIDIRGVIFKDNSLLLVKESNDGCWSLPGGWAEFNLSIKENVIKEALEEAGVKITPLRILAVLKHRSHATPYEIYKIFVLCEYIDGWYKNNIETVDCGFFDLNTLPPLSVGRNTKEQIEMCFNSKLKKNIVTIFD